MQTMEKTSCLFSSPRVKLGRIDVMKMLANRTAWVFDLDGTLTNPVLDFDKIRSELGLPKGAPILESIAERDAEEGAELHRKLFIIEREMVKEATPAPGAIELITWLRDTKGHSVGVLTRNERSLAIDTLHNIGLLDKFCEVDVLGRDCAQPKPHPQGVLKILTSWNVEPGLAVMVGDSIFDIAAGRNAGVATVYVPRDHDVSSAIQHLEIEERKEDDGLIRNMAVADLSAVTLMDVLEGLKLADVRHLMEYE
eukprot:TRINITY_DN17612_c0_g1_i1.p1 TRINITY_DN17612_c0_g1~~TRINITY_DN17612_c0_g1_i1.p1  ORF type:complete len:253 (-),score=34.27 TRINITY_DN17612_c0_g1_i1:8-766(-)